MKTLLFVLFAVLLIVLIIYGVSLLNIPHPFNIIIYLALAGAFLYFLYIKVAGGTNSID